MRRYVDTSHYRAPFKNMNLSGFGAVADGSGGGEADPYAAYATMFEKRDGMNYWTADAKGFAMRGLEQSHFQPLTADPSGDRVAIVGLSAEELAVLVTNPGAQIAFKATDWVNAKLAEGKAVIAPVWLLAPVVGATRELVAIPVADKERLKAAASTPIAGILAAPGGLGTNLFKIGLIAGGVVAGALVLGMVVKKKYKANKRRPWAPEPKRESEAQIRALGRDDALRGREFGASMPKTLSKTRYFKFYRAGYLTA